MGYGYKNHFKKKQNFLRLSSSGLRSMNDIPQETINNMIVGMHKPVNHRKNITAQKRYTP